MLRFVEPGLPGPNRRTVSDEQYSDRVGCGRSQGPRAICSAPELESKSYVGRKWGCDQRLQREFTPEENEEAERYKREHPEWDKPVTLQIRVYDVAPETKVKLTSAAETTATQVHWLWHEWLPKGVMSLLAGRPGDGKSQIALSIAATVTTGGEWPDGTECDDIGDVLIWSSEDEWNSTIVPRFLPAGGDPESLFRIDAAEGEPFDPSIHMPLLDEILTNNPDIRLVILVDWFESSVQSQCVKWSACYLARHRIPLGSSGPEVEVAPRRPPLHSLTGVCRRLS
jgi:hypothetical protein